jgi:hypothetical protein
MIKNDAEEDQAPAAVADRMVDAVTYLSRIADDAGLKLIAAKLRSVRRSLRHKAMEDKTADREAHPSMHKSPRQRRDR